MEIDAYRGLSKQYFYKGDIGHCDIYFERATKGIYEAGHSSQKNIAKQYYVRFKKTLNDYKNEHSANFTNTSGLDLKENKQAKINIEFDYQIIDYTCSNL